MDQQARRQVSWATRVVIILSLLVAVAYSFDRPSIAQTTGQPPQPMQPAEKVFQNIRVFNGMHAAELQGAMSFIASSLNVNCDHCHEQDFASDKLPAKLRAREMIRMVRQINQDAFHGQTVVNCFTCHQGRVVPVSISPLVLPAPTATAATSAASASDASLPSVAQVLDHYVQALGGQAALDHVKSRVVKTGPLSGGNPESTNELLQKEPGKVLLVNQSPGYTLWVGFNGQHAWAQDSANSYWGLLNTPQRNAIMRDSEMYQGSRLRSQYDTVTIVGRERIGDHDTYVIAGTSPEGPREKFFFDAQTGLLLRRYIEEPSIFGVLPVQADFEDYRDVDDVKMPFVIRWSSSGGAWGIRTSFKVLEVRQNVLIEDERFDHSSPLQ